MRPTGVTYWHEINCIIIIIVSIIISSLRALRRARESEAMSREHRVEGEAMA